jgi:hypothetical protein
MQYPNYKHFIITRFNVKQNDWNNPDTLLLLNENWLKERFELFDTFCLPSVQAQTCKNFNWLVYFDIDTPAIYKEVIESYRKLLPGFFPRFITDMSYLINSIREDITAELNDNTGRLNNVVITTRLDNDDLLHEDFIQIVQSLIRTKGLINGIIDIPGGYCLKVKPKPLVSTSTQFSNPFITYVEPYMSFTKLLTVMDKPHYEWDYSVKTIFIEKKRLWMQMIHEKNAFNKFQGIIVNNEKTLIPFNIKTTITFRKKSFNQLLYNNYIKFPFYYIKTQLKKMWIKQQNSARLPG